MSKVQRSYVTPGSRYAHKCSEVMRLCISYYLPLGLLKGGWEGEVGIWAERSGFRTPLGAKLSGPCRTGSEARYALREMGTGCLSWG